MSTSMIGGVSGALVSNVNQLDEVEQNDERAVQTETRANVDEFLKGHGAKILLGLPGVGLLNEARDRKPKTKTRKAAIIDAIQVVYPNSNYKGRPEDAYGNLKTAERGGWRIFDDGKTNIKVLPPLPQIGLRNTILGAWRGIEDRFLAVGLCTEQGPNETSEAYQGLLNQIDALIRRLPEYEALILKGLWNIRDAQGFIRSLEQLNLRHRVDFFPTPVGGSANNPLSYARRFSHAYIELRRSNPQADAFWPEDVMKHPRDAAKWLEENLGLKFNYRTGAFDRVEAFGLKALRP